MNQSSVLEGSRHNDIGRLSFNYWASYVNWLPMNSVPESVAALSTQCKLILDFVKEDDGHTTCQDDFPCQNCPSATILYVN